MDKTGRVLARYKSRLAETGDESVAMEHAVLPLTLDNELMRSVLQMFIDRNGDSEYELIQIEEKAQQVLQGEPYVKVEGGVTYFKSLSQVMEGKELVYKNTLTAEMLGMDIAVDPALPPDTFEIRAKKPTE